MATAGVMRPQQHSFPLPASDKPMYSIPVNPWAKNRPAELPAFNPWGGADNTMVVKAYQEEVDRQTSLDPMQFSSSNNKRQPVVEVRAARQTDFLFRDPVDITTANSGGMLEDLKGAINDSRRVGNSAYVDGQMADSQIPIREPSASYMNRNNTTKLADVIHWYTRLDNNMWCGPNGLFPYRRSTDNSIQWDEVEYRPGMVDATPELAPSRIIGFTRKTHTAGFTRYALSIRTTTDYLKSPEGQEQFARQLKHMILTILEFDAFGALYALNEADDIHKRFVVENLNMNSSAAQERLLEDEVWRWDIFKTDKGAWKLDNYVMDQFVKWGGTADTWVITSDMAAYMTLEPHDRTSVAESGLEIAISNLQDSINAMQKWGLGNVMIARAFAVGSKAPVHPLHHFASIGEHHNMTNSLDRTSRDDITREEKATYAASVEIYDEGADKYSLITTAMALEYCELWDRDGNSPNNKIAGMLEPRSTDDTYETVGDKTAKPMLIPRDFMREDNKFFDTMLPYLVQACKTDRQRTRMYANDVLRVIRQWAQDQNIDWQVLSQELGYTMKNSAYPQTYQKRFASNAADAAEDGRRFRIYKAAVAIALNAATTEATDADAALTVVRSALASETVDVAALAASPKDLTEALSVYKAFYVVPFQKAVFERIRTESVRDAIKLLSEELAKTGGKEEVARVKTDFSTILTALATAISTATAAQVAAAAKISPSDYNKTLVSPSTDFSKPDTTVSTAEVAYYKDVSKGATEKNVTDALALRNATDVLDAAKEALAAVRRLQSDTQAEVSFNEGQNLYYSTATIPGGATSAYVATPSTQSLAEQLTDAIARGEIQELPAMVPHSSQTNYSSHFTTESKKLINTSNSATRKKVEDGLAGVLKFWNDEIIKKYCSNLEAFALQLYGTIPFNKANLLALNNAGITLPIAFVVRRPHALYEAQTAFKVKKGPETGLTYVHDGIFSLSEDASIQEIGGQFSYKVKTVILQENNVVAIRTAFISDYLGGFGTKPILKPDSQNGEGIYDPGSNYYGKGHFPDQSNGGRSPDPYRPSCYFFAEPYSEVNQESAPRILSLHKQLYAYYHGKDVCLPFEPRGMKVLSPMWRYYNAYWEFPDKIVPNANPYLSTVNFINNFIHVNATTWLGYTRHWSPHSKEFGSVNYTQPGTGHWKGLVNLGDNRWRSGKGKKQFV